ncbi:MAG: STAS domain-containing protein [Anaerolineales bacterium]|jgi:anti-anti-sigma regulatory factor|uniref:STAS domain-containing protein n=1 Tax=Candidatus Villigracilis vicinus TaxID=3140679 RepID=UPI0031360C39|nr:STAS domain-containing protein [Anaerolineales bacterium]MBK7450823.1 STAS domain-containing protein [Anaerolineales bacterium]MBK9780149.1 STAS domain-containing protein [Anaerolineales bacterium]
MEINISQEKGSVPVTVLELTGQLDGQTFKSLIASAQEALDGGAQNILLDMSGLTFISSAGLVSLHVIALLLRGEKLPDLEHGWAALKSVNQSRESGVQQHVKLLNPRPEIVNVLEMVGFSSFFEIFTDKQKALESFS